MYKVLYRKWRPQTFSDVVGQPQVTKTLVSQIKENRLSHAYLFTGSRGTGKTTCAKILAKAVNCLSPVDGNPCNCCEICRAIDNGTCLDIVEMDAASNNGVDDIRMLRDEVDFSPSMAKYRVYIIDEVHMLSTQAFNALLKTLEEPPEHVKFILATTEVHKLLPTILSRCQRFDFRRIEPRTIADRLLYVAENEGALLSEDAAFLIARLADGGMRDALSLLDRAISVSNEVTVETVSASSGLMGREHIYRLIEHIADKDTSACLAVIDELHNASCDTERLLGELTGRFRDFLVVKTVKHPENLIVATRDEIKRISVLADRFTPEQIIFMLKVLAEGSEASRKTQNKRIEAEMTVIRLCMPTAETDTAALQARISALENELDRIKAQGLPSYGAPPRTLVREESSAEEDYPRVFDRTPPPEDAPFENDVPAEENQFDFSEDDRVFDDDDPFGNGSITGGSDEPAKNIPEFSGFGNSTGGSFADAFKKEDEGDDEPFDFDKFMSENSPDARKAEKEDEDSHTVSTPPSDEAAAPAEQGPVDKTKWLKIILEVEKANKSNIGQLTGSSAFIRGNYLYVHPANPFVKVMTSEEYLAKCVAPAALAVLGHNYTVKYD